MCDVSSLYKKHDTQCIHCDDGVCTIYDTRPIDCQLFFCGWLLGMMEEEDRPDKMNAVLMEDGKVFIHPDKPVNKRLLDFCQTLGEHVQFYSGGKAI